MKNIAASIKSSENGAVGNQAEGDLSSRHRYSLGDPNCPICHGLGFVSTDVPFDDPRFGKLEICSCRIKEVTAMRRDQLFQLKQNRQKQ